MKITLNQDPAFEDTEVIINCPQVDEDILRMAAMLRVANQKMTGTLDGDIHIVDAKDILYIDTVDKKTFSTRPAPSTRAPCGCTRWKTCSVEWTSSAHPNLPL